MKRITIAVFVLLLAGCSFEKKGVEIEMLTMDGQWTPMITVHGFYDNHQAAQDVVRGLREISRTDSTMVRTYRIKDSR